jgi:membrane-associated phospholipid phosphatase
MDIFCYIIDAIVGVDSIDTFNSKNMQFSLRTIFDIIGYSAPGIMLVTSIIILRNKQKYLLYFIIGYVLTGLLNIILKFIIKEPRPGNDWKILKIGIEHKKRISFDKFGMPSGHAQRCGYILAFTALVLNDPLITGVYSILTLICMYQRYLYENHHIKQVLVGVFVGLFTGYLMYLVAAKKLMGNIKMKPDDNGPL